MFYYPNEAYWEGQTIIQARGTKNSSILPILSYLVPLKNFKSPLEPKIPCKFPFIIQINSDSIIFHSFCQPTSFYKVRHCARHRTYQRKHIDDHKENQRQMTKCNIITYIRYIYTQVYMYIIELYINIYTYKHI